MYSGYYPLGADCSSAPWNEKDPDFEKCDECNGRGYHYHAIDILTDEEVDVTKETWLCLPETDEEAIARRQHFIQGEKTMCDHCEGTGFVEIITEPDYD